MNSESVARVGAGECNEEAQLLQSRNPTSVKKKKGIADSFFGITKPCVTLSSRLGGDCRRAKDACRNRFCVRWRLTSSALQRGWGKRSEPLADPGEQAEASRDP